MKLNKLSTIAILSLPLLLGCGGGVSNDAKAVCDEANTILANNKDSINTCHDAVVLLANNLTKSYEFTDGNEFVYDSKAKQMVIMKGDSIVYSSSGYQKNETTLDYFKFVSSYNPNSKYSQYLKKSAIEDDTLHITTGFDAGYHKDIKNVVYNNYSGKKRNVIVRTYCDYLTINAPDDTIYHFADATNVIVNEVDNLNIYGSYAYVKAKSGNINFGYANENSMTDMFEVPVENKNNVVTKALDDKAYVYGLINWQKSKIEGLKTESKELNTVEVKTAAILTELATTGTANHIKLMDDIKYTSASSLQFNRAVCIDLNGHKLTFDNSSFSSASQIYEAMRVQSDTSTSTDKSLYIIDSEDYLNENSGINLINCSIVVSGTESKDITSNLVVNGGIIKQTITSDFTEFTKLGGAITCIGNTSSSDAKYAYVKTYGGRIVCDNKTQTSNKSGCLAAVGVGANIDVVYGSLISNDYCIYSQVSSGSYKLGDANIVVEGGSVTSTNNTCLYFPLNATINIDGGKLNGLSCINANTGTITITNSTLNATGQHFTYSETNYDGSPLYIPKGTTGDLTATITGSTLYSKFGYIVDVVGHITVTGTTNVNCKDGTYSYYLGNGVSKDCPNTTVETAGTWTKRSY